MNGLDQIQFSIQDLSWRLTNAVANRSVSEWIMALAPALVLEGPPVIGCALYGLYRWWTDAPDRLDYMSKAFLSSMPSVTVLLVGYNEEAGVKNSIRSVLQCGFPRMQLIVVDDGSTDGMAAQVEPFVKSGQILFVRNQAQSGRGGKPSGVNLGALYATGDFIITLDMDTICHPRLLHELIAPFHDPRVGAVGGNLRVQNSVATWLTRLQHAEYMVTIGIGRQWQQLMGMNIMASGACAAYRTASLRAFSGCDSVIGEDLDNSLKVRKAGWRLVFASRARAWTEVPETVERLARQRFRWDRDLVTLCLRKHGDALTYWREPFCWELWRCLLLTFIAPVVMVAYVTFLFSYSPQILALALGVNLLFYEIITATALIVSWSRWPDAVGIGRLLLRGLALPFYQEFLLRPVRCYASIMELLKCAPDDPYLPPSAWRNLQR